MTFYKVLHLLQLYHLYSLWKRKKFYHEKLCLEIWLKMECSLHVFYVLSMLDPVCDLTLKIHP